GFLSSTFVRNSFTGPAWLPPRSGLTLWTSREIGGPMKHSMAVKILVAGVCALGTAALAQTDANPNNSANQQPGNTETMPSDSPTGYGSETPATAPSNKNMTMSEKKQSLENIKKAIRASETQQGRMSGEQGTSAE